MNASCPPGSNLSAALPDKAYFNHFYFPDWDRSPLLQARRAVSVLTLLFLVAGIAGNIATFPTLHRYRSLRVSTRMFFFGMAAGDIVGMPLSMFYTWYEIQFAHNLGTDNDFFCSFYQVLMFWGMANSWCCLAAISIERFLLVSIPQRMRTARPRKYAAFTLVANLILSFLAAGIYAGYAVTKDCVCMFVWPLDVMQASRAYWYLLFVVVVCQVIFSAVALRRILIKRKIGVQPSTAGGSKKGHNSALSPVMMALAVGVFECVSMLPFFVWTIKSLVLGDKTFLISAGADVLIFDAFQVIMTLNFGANFYIFLVACRGFRESFLSFLPSRKDFKIATEESAA